MFKADGVDDPVCMDMPPVHMGGITHLIAAKERGAAYKLPGNVKGFAWSHVFAGGKALDKVLVLPASHFAPYLFGIPHFLDGVHGRAVMPADQPALRFFAVCDIVYGPRKACP